MSTERTIYEDEERDIYINHDLITGKLFIYENYGCPNSVEIEITAVMIQKMLLAKLERVYNILIADG